MVSDAKPAVIVTGDVHQCDSTVIREQRFYDGNETSAAKSYAEILGKYGLKGTLFYTGRCFRDEINDVQAVAGMEHIEIGGHTYNCYKPRIVYKVWRRLTGYTNGPRILQEWDIRRTLQAAQAAGIKITTWRNHAYVEDANTLDLLLKFGITHVSNEVGPYAGIKRKVIGDRDLISVGINVWPDHDHMVHGDLKLEAGVSRRLVRNRFPNNVFQPLDWLEQVVQDINVRLSQGRHAVLLVHPGCMMTLGGMWLFELLCQKIAHLPTAGISEIRSDEGPVSE
ncbi:hypothetical protein [Sulfurovum sp.]|uniref:hypothetical protein n=1 Tax=Sulfurovum sp. TaxID=1969726 RepID=UPI003569765D